LSYGGILYILSPIAENKRLVEDKTYTDISAELDASTATITKIGQVIKYGKKSLEKVVL